MEVVNTDINMIDNLANSYDEANIPPFYGMSSLKQEALESLREHGLPDHKNEEYKYFDVLRKIKRDYSFIIPDPVGIDPSWISTRMVNDPDAVHIVHINGNFSASHSTLNATEEGLEFISLREISEKSSETFDLYLRERQNVNKDPYLDLNNALLNAGYIMHINPRFKTKPIYVYHFITDYIEDVLINKKGIILLDRDSKADIIEIFYSDTPKHYFRNYNAELFVKEGSLLNYYLVQETGEEAVCINNTNVYQSENSRANTYTFSLRGKHLRNNLNMLLNQENSESHLYGLYFIANNDVVDNHTTVDHKKPHCFSNEYYKGIIDDSGTGTFNGKIYVRPHAQKTNAFQSNKNLVLTDTATVNTKPQLEIWADDVKCSHGATTGQLDKEQMFYLRSRGLEEESATALLLHAFAFDIVDKIELDHLKKYLGNKINVRLGYQFSE
jgi:Fe-S cluster assembly protein SufD